MNIKIQYILLLVIFALPFKAMSSSDSSLASANAYYIDNKFEEAIYAYEEIINSGNEAAELYFNLGNAYYKTHNIAKTVLNYERALLLDPNDEDILFNLEMANSLVVDKLEEIPPLFLKVWMDNIAELFHTNGWAVLSMVSFLLFLIFVLFYLFTKKLSVKKITFWIGVISILISIFSFGFSSRHKKLLTHHNQAIIMESSLTAKSTPDVSGTDLFVVHEGTKVKIDDKVGEWVEIRLVDGNKGWVPVGSVEKI